MRIATHCKASFASGVGGRELLQVCWPPMVALGGPFALAPFPFSTGHLRNGPQPSRARGVCAAEENLFRF